MAFLRKVFDYSAQTALVASVFGVLAWGVYGLHRVADGLEDSAREARELRTTISEKDKYWKNQWNFLIDEAGARERRDRFVSGSAQSQKDNQ